MCNIFVTFAVSLQVVTKQYSYLRKCRNARTVSGNYRNHHTCVCVCAKQTQNVHIIVFS